MKSAAGSKAVGIGVLFVGLAALVFAAAGRSSGSSSTSGAGRSQEGKLRVGVFNSRAVALAYGRSDKFNRWVKELMAEAKEAKAAGDEERMAELEKKGSSQQDRLHRQVFGNAPIGDILKKLEPVLPEVAGAAGVSVIATGIAYRDPSVEIVDVTDMLVQQWNPDEKTLKTIEELLKHAPVEFE